MQPVNVLELLAHVSSPTSYSNKLQTKSPHSRAHFPPQWINQSTNIMWQTQCHKLYKPSHSRTIWPGVHFTSFYIKPVTEVHLTTPPPQHLFPPVTTPSMCPSPVGLPRTRRHLTDWCHRGFEVGPPLQTLSQTSPECVDSIYNMEKTSMYIHNNVHVYT